MYLPPGVPDWAMVDGKFFPGWRLMTRQDRYENLLRNDEVLGRLELAHRKAMGKRQKQLIYRAMEKRARDIFDELPPDGEVQVEQGPLGIFEVVE